MRNEYSQVHGPKLPGEDEAYTYESLPWFDIGRLAIYLVSFAFFFTIARHFVVAFF